MTLKTFNTSPSKIDRNCPVACAARDAGLIERIDALTEAVRELTLTVLRMQGIRLTRDQLAERLRVHRNTLPRWMAQDPRFPRPDRHGKWLLAEVVEWEQRK